MPSGAPIDQEPAAAEIAGARVGDGERERGGDRRVDRVAAASEDVEPDRRRVLLRRDDHSASAGSGTPRGRLRRARGDGEERQGDAASRARVAGTCRDYASAATIRKMRQRHGFVALLVFAIALAGCRSGGSGARRPRRQGETAPEFELKDVEGHVFHMSDAKGTVRLVDFWATWCAPCREEIPMFKDLHAAYAGKGFTLVGIAMDDEGLEIVKPYVDEMKIPYLTLLGNDGVAQSFGGVFGFPSKFLVDREGRIVDCGSASFRARFSKNGSSRCSDGFDFVSRSRNRAWIVRARIPTFQVYASDCARDHVVSAGGVSTLSAAAAAPPSPPARRGDSRRREAGDGKSASAGIAALGGRVLHTLGDMLISELPPGREITAYRVAGVRAVALNEVSISRRESASAASYGRSAWNEIVAGPRFADRPEVTADPLIDDALTPPAVSLEAVRLSRGPGAVPSSTAPYGATALNTSEFLAGSLSVNVVLVESDGTIDGRPKTGPHPARARSSRASSPASNGSGCRSRNRRFASCTTSSPAAPTSAPARVRADRPCGRPDGAHGRGPLGEGRPWKVGLRERRPFRPLARLRRGHARGRRHRLGRHDLRRRLSRRRRREVRGRPLRLHLDRRPARRA